ncbi:hypothetical protein IV203_021071 [Nitzschia inconspicua]|uniref:Uncharacterized protein n=1 Tax=Nitzschia inconspicua TaxID=303405 RepID=A0A9K3KH77_9STRA|nr:hypothetical protein IV203_021071 [Nitzschia inconspicua]
MQCLFFFLYLAAIHRTAYGFTATISVVRGAGVVCTKGSTPPAPLQHNGHGTAFRTDCNKKSIRLSSSKSSSTNAKDMEAILEEARRVAFGENDAEYEAHYHPYKDEDEQLRVARYWLQQVVDNAEEDATDIVDRLQRKIAKYERRIAKRKGADSVVPSIALELSLVAMFLVVGIFWTTLDMTQRHEVTPANLRDWMSLAQEKGYLVNMLNFGGKF